MYICIHTHLNNTLIYKFNIVYHILIMFSITLNPIMFIMDVQTYPTRFLPEPFEAY